MLKFIKGLASHSFVSIPVVAFLIFFLHFFQVVDFHEADAVDLRFRIRGKRPAHSDMILVMVDDASVAAIGEWPWPRSNHAVLLDVLSKYKPRSVFFDVLFTEASPGVGEDEKFAFAIKKAGNVILPFFYQSAKPFQATFPIPVFREAARDVGYVNVDADADGRVRHVKAFLKTEQGVFYHPAVAIMRSEFNDPEKAKKWWQRLPLDSKGNFWVNFPGPLSSFKRISFGNVILNTGSDDNRLRELFQNKIVLIGHTATGTTDLKPTPFSTQTPGLVVQASALHTLLSGNALRSIPEPAHLLILLLLSALVTFFSLRLAPLRAFWAAIGITAVYAAANILLFIFAEWILPLYVPVAVVWASYGLVLFIKYTEIRMQREMIDRELQMAAKIQENFLTQNKPEAPELDSAFECRFIKQVGGDLYEWTDLGGDRYGFCVGDVSGKGMPAAIYMAKALSDFRGIEKRSKNPGEICAIFNNALAASNFFGMFLTLVYAEIDIKRRKITYASAGHEAALLYRSRTKETQILTKAQGTPLAVVEDAIYETEELPFEPGDYLLFYSDGVKELRNPQKEEFGVERLRQVFESIAVQEMSADEMIKRIFVRMQQHQAGGEPHDDRTLLCVRFAGGVAS